MAVQTLETLKGYFSKGKLPTQSNYEDLLDTVFSLIQGNSGLPQVDINTYTGAKVGDIVQHIGETADDNYGDTPVVNGYIYKCILTRKIGDTVLSLNKTSNTIDNYRRYPEIPSGYSYYYEYEELPLSTLNSYKENYSTNYVVLLATEDDQPGPSISTSQISKLFVAMDGHENKITVIKIYNGKYYRRTNRVSASCGTTYGTWQELSYYVENENSCVWKSINAHPHSGFVKEIALCCCDCISNYYHFSGDSRYQYSSIARSPLTPIPIDDLVKFAGLDDLYYRGVYPEPEKGDMNDVKKPSTSAILVILNSGFSRGVNGDYTCYVSWDPSADDWWGSDSKFYGTRQIAAIPFGCSIAFSYSEFMNCWMPVGTFTPISEADLTAKEDEYLGN